MDSEVESLSSLFCRRFDSNARHSWTWKDDKGTFWVVSYHMQAQP